MALPTRRPEIGYPTAPAPATPAPVRVLPANVRVLRPGLPTSPPAVVKKPTSRMETPLDADLHAQAKALAVRLGIPLTEGVRMALTNAVVTGGFGMPTWGPGRIKDQRDAQWVAYSEGRGPHPLTVALDGTPLQG